MKLSSREKKLLIFLAVFAAVGLLAVAVVMPSLDQLNALTADKATYKELAMLAKANNAPIAQLEERLQEVTDDTQLRLDKYLPVYRQDMLMSFVEQMAQISGLTVNGIRFENASEVSLDALTAPVSSPDALTALVRRMNSLRAGHIPPAPSSGPASQPSPGATAASESQQSGGQKIKIVYIMLSVVFIGNYSQATAFVEAVSDSGKAVPVSGIKITRALTGE
ncbi:MAG: hypothetical protein Q8O09_05495, partial [Bacillota bacterium]|nr:hypothetical protein [Bacillota bacterium]